MKYIKTFEVKFADDGEDRSDWKVGDEVYCISNRGDNDKILHIGQKYKIEQYNSTGGHQKERNGSWKTVPLIFIGSGRSFYGNRFSKNPKHPKIAQHRFDL